jgi:hypothetical protein
MKTLTKLTLTALAGAVLVTTAFAGPAPPYGPVQRVPREVPAAAPMKCKNMTVNRSEKLGGFYRVACTKAVKETLGCRLACR